MENPENAQRWGTVRIPQVLLDRVIERIKKKDSTYTSAADFVTDAVRKELRL